MGAAERHSDMTPPKQRRDDEPTISNVLERVVTLEADSRHTDKDIGRIEKRLESLLIKLESAINRIPTDKDLDNAINTKVYSAISKQAAKCKGSAGGLDWKAKTGMFVAIGTGLAALIKGLTG
jgi:hypothetical protein